MSTAKVFKSGNSQAVRLPKKFQFDTREVEIFRRGDEVVLRSRVKTMADVASILSRLSLDFMEDARVQAHQRAEDRKLGSLTSGRRPVSAIIIAANEKTECV